MERRRASRSQERSGGANYDLGIAAVRPNGSEKGSKRIAKASMNLNTLGSTLNGSQSAEAEAVEGAQAAQAAQAEPLAGELKGEEGEGAGKEEGGGGGERFVLPGGLSLNGLTLDGFDWGKGIVSGATSSSKGTGADSDSDADGSIVGASRKTSSSTEVGRVELQLSARQN